MRSCGEINPTTHDSMVNGNTVGTSYSYQNNLFPSNG